MFGEKLLTKNTNVLHMKFPIFHAGAQVSVRDRALAYDW